MSPCRRIQIDPYPALKSSPNGKAGSLGRLISSFMRKLPRFCEDHPSEDC